jgi:tetratricopeptide (TPR) repeat protein
MKKLMIRLIISTAVIAAFVILDINRPTTASATTLFSAIPQDAPLTLSQIEDLIKAGTPDNTIAKEIKERGIDFRVNASQLARLKSLNAEPKTIRALQVILNVQAILDKTPKKRRTPPIVPPPPPKGIIILVADFKSLSERNFGVTEKIIQQLRVATSEYSDISVQALGQPVTEQQGSEVARAIGIKRKASIVLWGYYNATSQAVDISVYFEVLQKPEGLALRQKLETQTSPISELEGVKIQTRLSKEMTYLTLMTVGLARYESKDYDGAIKRFTTALAQSDVPDKMIDPADIYLYRGNAYHFQAGANGIDKAIADYDKAIKINPDFERAYYNRGTAYGNKGQFDLAIADLDKAIEINPEDAEAYNNRGIAYVKKGQHDLAIADFGKSIEIKPDYSQAYYNRAFVYHEKSQYDLAIADLDKAIEIKPDDVEAYYNRGTVYGKKGQHDLAIADFNKAIKINPGLAQAYNNRGLTYNNNGQFDLAIADYDKAIKIKPDDAEAYYNRGITYREKGQHDLAIADFNKAIEINPDLVQAYYNRAFVYHEKRQYDLAIADFDKAIEINPEDAEAYYNRGIVYSKKRRFDLAIANFGKSIEIKPDYSQAYYTRALAYLIKGERDRAIADFKSVLRISKDPNIRQLAEQRLQELGVK